MLFGIEGGRVVLEVLDQGSGLRSLIEDLRLAFIDAATAAHGSIPWLCEIHGMPWLQFPCRDPRRRQWAARLNAAAPPQHKSYPKAARSTIDIDPRGPRRNVQVRRSTWLP